MAIQYQKCKYQSPTRIAAQICTCAALRQLVKPIIECVRPPCCTTDSAVEESIVLDTMDIHTRLTRFIALHRRIKSDFRKMPPRGVASDTRPPLRYLPARHRLTPKRGFFSFFFLFVPDYDVKKEGLASSEAVGLLPLLNSSRRLPSTCCTLRNVRGRTAVAMVPSFLHNPENETPVSYQYVS